MGLRVGGPYNITITSEQGVKTYNNIYLSLDPTNRIWMSDQDQYLPPVGLNEVMRGGTLGVVEHRAKADVADDDDTGYVGQQQVIAMAEAAGFRLDARSEVNANPRDTTVHPNGVWTLPPSNRHDPEDAQMYRSIGESDRMTLRFRKPARD